jgi:hypothetical protein
VSHDDRAARVTWPAVLKYAAADGLVVVDSLSAWDVDPDMYARPYQPEDRLIDSAGLEYRLGFAGEPGSGHATVEPTGRTYSAGEFRTVAVRHLRAIGAPEEWLAAHLEDIPEAHQVRTTVQYIARLGDAKGDDEAEAEEEE